jgi:aminoglycoside 3-N-acetyltransferase
MRLSEAEETELRQQIISELAESWRKCGVESGRMMLLHSSAGRSLRHLAKVGLKPDPRILVESFLEALGPQGTLLLPLFNFDFAAGVPFDIRQTPSRMGALTEAGRTWPDAVRTGHPIYSFAAIGAEATAFQGLRNFSGYGPDSPFGILHRADGVIGILDLPDNQSMTFYHYVEESCGVSYRYHKVFEGMYTDAGGVTKNERYGLFVRDLTRGVVTSVDPMGELLWERGNYRGKRPGEGCGLRTVRATELFDAVATVIAESRAEGLLYVTDEP